MNINCCINAKVYFEMAFVRVSFSNYPTEVNTCSCVVITGLGDTGGKNKAAGLQTIFNRSNTV